MQHEITKKKVFPVLSLISHKFSLQPLFIGVLGMRDGIVDEAEN